MSTPRRASVLTAWRHPAAVPALTTAQWTDTLWSAGRHKCLARLSYRLEDAGCAQACPGPARDLLWAARYFPSFVQVRIAREIRHVAQALGDRNIPFLLLKGGAYLAAGFPLARGRAMKDLDIMVHRGELDAAERALRDAGLISSAASAYDQHYYRTWMHEIPPLYHPDRGIEVDVHHRILPATSRLNPDPEAMWRDAVALPAIPGAYVLSPYDMLLHVAAHLFHDGEIRGGFRDLLDIDELIAAHGARPDYWTGLTQRAAELELGRPLYYALRFTRWILGTPIPQSAVQESHLRFAPSTIVDALMGRLVAAVLPPRPRAAGDARLAAWLLYLRSHWLRMPPGLLLRHLGRKGLMRVMGKAPHATSPSPDPARRPEGPERWP